MFRKCELAFKCWVNQNKQQHVTEGKGKDGHHKHSWSLGTILKVFWYYMNRWIKEIAWGPPNFSFIRTHSWWFCLWSHVKTAHIFSPTALQTWRTIFHFIKYRGEKNYKITEARASWALQSHGLNSSLLKWPNLWKSYGGIVCWITDYNVFSRFCLP